MIYDKLSNSSYYEGLGDGFKKAFAWLKSTDLAALETGRYELEGSDLYVMIQDQVLKPWEEGRWEAHKIYADIQLVIRGQELMGFAMTEDMEIEEAYNPQKDVLFAKPGPLSAAVVKEGEMMIFFPQDAHRPGISPENGRGMSKKALVKIRIK